MGHLDVARALHGHLAPDWGIAGAYQWGTVGAVHATSSPPTVDVYLDGSSSLTTGLRYLTSYAPVVSDVVMIGRMQGRARTARVVLGTLAPGAVTTYTPTWTTAGGSPAIGSGGSITGRYALLGKLCWLSVSWVVGSSGFNGGTGAFSFSLPSGITVASGLEQDLLAHGYAPNAGGNFTGFAPISSPTFTVFLPTSSSNLTMSPAQNANSGGGSGTGVPVASGNFTWTNAGNIEISGTFLTT